MKKKYEIFDSGERIASDMSMDVMICVIRGYILGNPYKEIDLEVREMERTEKHIIKDIVKNDSFEARTVPL